MAGGRSQKCNEHCEHYSPPRDEEVFRAALALLREKDALLAEWDAKLKDYETELLGKVMDIEKLKACCDEKDALIAELTKIISEMKGENYD